jgi:hypothetical protein
VELADQVATAHQPDIFAGRGHAHLVVHRPHVATHETDAGAGHGLVGPGREHPGRLLVGPGAGLRRAGPHDVPQHPLVCRRTHGQRTHAGDELRIAGGIDVTQREQPLERIVGRGNEAVEAARGVVLGLHRGLSW